MTRLVAGPLTDEEVTAFFHGKDLPPGNPTPPLSSPWLRLTDTQGNLLAVDKNDIIGVSSNYIVDRSMNNQTVYIRKSTTVKMFTKGVEYIVIETVEDILAMLEA